jgi:dTMP kinase
MFVVFEGIDGSGKTTISNRAARALRQSGLTVTHVREGGKLASTVAQSIRDFGRDERHLALGPYAELLVYLAREAQLYDEVTQPALAAADVVIADRFFYSAEVLACAGRGLAPELVRPLVGSAAREVVPDLVILIDVDPHIARARRRVAKILKDEDEGPPSRKGLAGASLFHRMRDGYLELAARDPERWLVLDNSNCELQAIVDLVVEAVERARRSVGAAPSAVTVKRHARRRGHVPAPRGLDIGGALPALLDWVDRRAPNEPALAAYMLSGLSGPAVDERRIALAMRAPEITAVGLQGLDDATSWGLRWTLLDRAPRHVARSLGAPTPDCDQRDRLTRTLMSIAPADLAASTSGDAGAAAFALRDALYASVPGAVTASLATLDHPEAWAIRERFLDEVGGVPALDGENARVACRSIAGLDDARSWEIRLAARDVAPIAALASLAGLSSAAAWRWREEALAVAPKTVLATVRGMDDPLAWALRAAVAPRCKEAIDSLSGMDEPRAWSLRAAYADLWPGGVVKSLGMLADTPRGLRLVADLLERHPTDISLLRHAAAVELTMVVPSETKAA